MATVGFQTMAESIQGITLNLGNKQEVNGTNGNCFGSVLDQSIQSKSKLFETHKTNRSQETPVMTQTSKVNSKSSKKTSTSDDQEKVNKKTKVDPSKITNMSDLMQQLKEMCDNINQSFKDQLGMSDEEFEQALEELGMTMIDMFDPNQVTKLFLHVNGVEDSSELLTNEELSMNLRELMNQFDEIVSLEKMELTPEDLKVISEQLESQNPNEEFILMDQTDEDAQKLDVKVSANDEATEENTVNTTVTSTVEQTTEGKHTENNNTNSSMDKKSSKQEITSDVKFVVNGSTDISQQAKVDFFDQLAPTSQAKEIVDQLVQEIKVKISPSQTHMEMVLTPETLGRVNLHVSAKDGVMTAHLITQTEEAKEAIESQISILKESLESQGLKVEAVEVTVETNSFDFMNQSQMGQQEQQEQNQLKKSNGRLRMTEDSLEEEAEQSITENINASIGKGTQIDFSA